MMDKDSTKSTMFHREEQGNDESLRCTRVVLDDKGKFLSKSGLYQATPPTWEQAQEARRQELEWVQAQTNIIMAQMATMTPQELSEYDWDESDEEFADGEHEREKESDI